MATIKSFTSIEQSRKLAEILPLESADMWWAWYSSPFDNGHYDDFPMFYKPICNPDESVPCWSLAALFGVLPNEIDIFNKTLGWFDDAWHCAYMDKDSESMKVSTSADNPVDACYELILKLNELNLL